ncbi:conjugal transfer protein TraQ [Serratia fonticola]|uniref:conjugal transfer protein TraQ n=1 Tax=Serratia fonticola TaxID=47917 RepID=UPI0013785D1C|nr:conjugal transfer protein TraQ [Serratia fonticola]NCG53658.1 conjugal transfer protein TraQ [Serratia fonticola]
MRKWRFPELDVLGQWIVAIGIWFHIVAGLVRNSPSMAVMLGEAIAVVLTLWGGYRILNQLLKSKKTEDEQHD